MPNSVSVTNAEHNKQHVTQKYLVFFGFLVCLFLCPCYTVTIVMDDDNFSDIFLLDDSRNKDHRWRFNRTIAE
jgi:hypothetical protein